MFLVVVAVTDIAHCLFLIRSAGVAWAVLECVGGVVLWRAWGAVARVRGDRPSGRAIVERSRAGRGGAAVASVVIARERAGIAALAVVSVRAVCIIIASIGCWSRVIVTLGAII